MNNDEARMLYEVYAQRARQQTERSHALPRRFYGDPAENVKFDRESGGRMQRDIDAVELLLDLWADWMRRPESLADTYPEKSPGFIHSWQKDFDEMVEAADVQQVEKINGCFDSLTPRYRDAIFRHYGLGAQVWRFDRAVNFEDAKIVIRVKFVAKGLI